MQLTARTLLDPEHSYVLGAEHHMCWGKAAIIQELEAPTPLSRKLALALAACSTFDQMVRQALRGIEWSFGRHLVERRRTASLPLSSILPEESRGTPGRAGVKQRIYPSPNDRRAKSKRKDPRRRKLADSPTLSQVHEGQSVRVRVRYSMRAREFS